MIQVSTMRTIHSKLHEIQLTISLCRLESYDKADSDIDMENTGRKGSRRSSPAVGQAGSLAIKRSDAASVTLKGWLYKQGSDGLQFWKKRWFVLSEYCLFYYKGPDEKNVLGSILLPSYKISPLSKDDGVYRKYAFKAEHTNMRTYYFAAETKDSMIQWMNSLSLASILQNENKLKPELLSREPARQSYLSPHLRHFTRQQSFPQYPPQHVWQQEQQQNEFSPHHVDQFDGHIHGGENCQPLYANAPPKPKRLNTSRDYSASPDNSPEREGRELQFTQQTELQQVQGVSGQPQQFRNRPPPERRTPEAYGRSRFKNSQLRNPNISHYSQKDYEEVYNNGYNNSPVSDKRHSEEVSHYTLNNSSQERRLSSNNTSGLPRAEMTEPGVQHNNVYPGKEIGKQKIEHKLTSHHGLPFEQQRVPRPHSADFLEFDGEKETVALGMPGRESRNSGRHGARRNQQPQRPKSCIGGKVRPDDFWSEEVYAQKMRESSFVYDQSGGSRSVSRASQQIQWGGGGRTPNQDFPPTSNSRQVLNKSFSPRNSDQDFHPLQLSPAQQEEFGTSPNFPQQLPPPVFYQDKNPHLDNSYIQSQRRDNEIVQSSSENHSYPSRPEAGQGLLKSPQEGDAKHTLSMESQLSEKKKIVGGFQSFNQTSQRRCQQSTTYHEDNKKANTMLQNDLISHADPDFIMQKLSSTMYLQHPQWYDHQTEMFNQQHNEFHNQLQNQDISVNQTGLPTNSKTNVNKFIDLKLNQKPAYEPSWHLSTNSNFLLKGSESQALESLSHPHESNNMFRSKNRENNDVFNLKNIGSAANDPYKQDTDPVITQPPSFPQPLPRKQQIQAHHTPTQYQNIPANSKAYSDPQQARPGFQAPFSQTESATPNRFSERIDSDRSADSQGEFRRSSSARLPKHKARALDHLNNTLNEEAEERIRGGSEQVGREESMKRLLDWKQRMLQSPLTRKSSRNASRTQTPTNSDSPVPSLNNDEIRKKVLEELQHTGPSTPNLQTKETKERRLSRKGSSGSRSSRSRSSPRIAPSKNQIYSSDDDELATVDLRSVRKRTKSQPGRSTSSRPGSRGQGAGSKSRSRSASTTSPANTSGDQPEYINVDDLKKGNPHTKAALSPDHIKLNNAIGPDDWYREEDFDFDRTHPFMDDPLLLKQYAQILDMKYRDSSTERIEAILKQSSRADHVDLVSKFDDFNQQKRQSLLKKGNDHVMEETSSPQKTHVVTDEKVEFSRSRYPDSGYDTLRIDLNENQPHNCKDIDIHNSEEGNIQSWQSSKFSEFQLMNKGGETVLLSIDGQGDHLESTVKRSSRDKNTNKVDWSAGLTYKEIQKEKEAPPKNVVKDILKSVQPNEGPSYLKPVPSLENVISGTTPTPLDEKSTSKNSMMRELTMQNMSRDEEKYPESLELFQVSSSNGKGSQIKEEISDSEGEQILIKSMDPKKSVKDLLSDFEKKSKALHEKEDVYRGVNSFLMQDSRDGGGRRVFSDTETLMYETSSEEEISDEYSQDTNYKKGHLDKNNDVIVKDEYIQQSMTTVPPSEPPPLPPKKRTASDATMQLQISNSKDCEINKPQSPQNSEDDNAIRPELNIQSREEIILNEETYLTMTPPKNLSSLPSTPARKHNQMVVSSYPSKTSLTSSHGSSQSITSQGLQQFGSDKNLGSMTPTEALIHSSSTSICHSRTPSQTLVIEHFQDQKGSRRLDEETYVDMNEDGSYSHEAPSSQAIHPILAKQCMRIDNLDSTLTYESPESPRYCEIEDTRGKSHYEYLCNATSANPQQYEVVYQEISERIKNEKEKYVLEASSLLDRNNKPLRKKEPEPLRPIEGLPDILGNAPTNKGNTSSDADDESSKEFDTLEAQSQPEITLDDSFRPASFYLSHCNSRKSGNMGQHSDVDDDSSDSDLVSPPPVPSSPPPMEEVLGYCCASNGSVLQNDLDAPTPPDNLNSILTAAKSAHAIRERSRKNSYGEGDNMNRRPSVGSRTSNGSANQSLSAALGSQQSLSRETMSPHQLLYSSHQSLSSRELPPLPEQGSQQSLASKEIQLLGNEECLGNLIRNSPSHSREGSLDNEAFLYHKFTQGTSIVESSRRQGSDSADFFSDTANYEQEYRRYHLENIQEVSNTLERIESGSHNTSIISQDLNISYNSVYDSRLQQSKLYKLEDHPVLKKRKSLDERQNSHKFFQPDPHSKEIEEKIDQQQSTISLSNDAVNSPRSKVPYYVSDIMDDCGTLGQTSDTQVKTVGFPIADNLPGGVALAMVDVITQSMNALDVESNSYFETKNEVENERIKMLRRSYTPDPYLTKSGAKGGLHNKTDLNSFESCNVSRSKSLEGLLGDSHGGPKDNLGYVTPIQQSISQHAFGTEIVPPPSNNRGPPPPPPIDVPPLDIQPMVSPLKTRQQSPSYTSPDSPNKSIEDEVWANNLRQVSIRQQRARSSDSSGVGLEMVSDPGQPKLRQPPPTAPKPKTPVHMLHTSLPERRQQLMQSPGTGVCYSQQNYSAENQTQSREGHTISSSIRSTEMMEKSFNIHPQAHKDQKEYDPQQNLSEHLYINSSPRYENKISHQKENRWSLVPLRNTVHMRQDTFLEHSLPSPISEPEHPVTQPGNWDQAASPDWMGRPSHTNSRSATLPARIKYSQDGTPRSQTDVHNASMESGSESTNSPRTRTSKSGISEMGNPVPPSPRSPADLGVPAVKILHPNQFSFSHSNSLPREGAGHPTHRDATEVNRYRKRNNSTGRKSTDLETLKKKFGGNLANITAGDLLGKSHEELVLILIQLRRQAASLSEAIDCCKAELDNMRNQGTQQGELRHHTWELEEQLARVSPVINLVDNMVKLGSLHRVGDSTPFTQRVVDQMEKDKAQGNLEQTQNRAVKKHPANIKIKKESFTEQQKQLEEELVGVQTQLQIIYQALEESGPDMVQLEQELHTLTQQMHNSVLQDQSHGKTNKYSQDTITLEQRVREVQGTAGALALRRGEMLNNFQDLTKKEDFLTNEIRPSPTWVAGAEPVPQKNRVQETWYETDIDNNYTQDRGPEVDEPFEKETKMPQGQQNTVPMYVNTYGEERHNYENYEQFKVTVAHNPYEDDVATVHSEGVRSEFEGPPLPFRPGKCVDGEDFVQGLGDISEADERVQRFYGIIPKEKPSEIKTVRMVKRDNKERSSKVKKNGEDDSESIDLSMDEEEPPPLPLPRGNYNNLHNFLSNQPYDSQNVVSTSQNNGYTFSPNSQNDKTLNDLENNNKGFQRNLPRPNFKLGEYNNKRPSEAGGSRPGSSLSAHERLFGTSRDDSISPDPASPVKASSINSSDSSQSAIMSPVFKSAAARAIIEEERKTPVNIIPKARKKNKKRHMTISGSNPAVLEALSAHQAKEAQSRSRARDDLDMERMLKPRDAPDVVRSTFDSEFRSNAIDNLFGAPKKISIPERYVPEETDEQQSPEERQNRLKKADSIRRMLADSSSTPLVKRREGSTSGSNISEDKKQREQILALNQVLARQVMEKSRMVAGQWKE